jgi:hypothetical protein
MVLGQDKTSPKDTLAATTFACAHLPTCVMRTAVWWDSLTLTCAEAHAQAPRHGDGWVYVANRTAMHARNGRPLLTPVSERPRPMAVRADDPVQDPT